MDNEERRRDEELAAFIDAVLSGRDHLQETARPPLAETVELLARTLGPSQPSEDLCLRLRQRVAAEWVREPSTRGRIRTRAFAWRQRRWVWVAAAALAVLAVATALLAPGSPAAITGTAAGQASTVALVIAIGLIGGVAMAMWLASRR